MLHVTRDLVLPTTITGSYPKPNWYTQGLHGRPFKEALGDSLFREQYLDAVAAILNEQTMAGLDIVTDGDARFDLAVGGKSANMVRRELGLPEAPIRAADERFAFGHVPDTPTAG